jgi:uncharacterized Zn finger protein
VPASRFQFAGISQSVADLVEEPTPRRLASPADYERGQSLVERGAARLREGGPLRVVVEVGDDEGGEDRQVELRSTPEGLAWSCDCPSAAAGAFCAHSVAASVITWRSAPNRRG